jgi:CO/xanthine dehydrogenase FAD-binding subunit
VACPAAEDVLVGQRLDDDVIARAADLAFAVAKPMDNTDFELVWRKKIVRAIVTHALCELRGDDMRPVRARYGAGLLF